MTEELFIREIRIKRGHMPRQFTFTDDEFRGHYTTQTPINYESPIIRCVGNL